MKNGNYINEAADAVKLDTNGGVSKYFHPLWDRGGRGICENGPGAVIEMCQSARYPQESKVIKTLMSADSGTAVTTPMVKVPYTYLFAPGD